MVDSPRTQRCPSAFQSHLPDAFQAQSSLEIRAWLQAHISLEKAGA